MTAFIERVVGMVLILGALAGLVVNIAGLTFVPRVEEQVQTVVEKTLNDFNNTLTTISTSLKVVDSSLENAEKTLEVAVTTTHDVAKAVDDTVPLLNTIGNLTGKELPSIVSSTQDSLAAAEQGAVTVELLLNTLNTIPLLNIPPYNPPVPLNQSLNNISASLEPLGDSFSQIESNLKDGSQSIEQVTADIDQLADTLAEVDNTLSEAKGVSIQFQKALDQQKEIINTLQTNIEPAIMWTSRAVSLVLIWLVIAQLGLLWQGFEMVGRSRRR